MAFDVAYVPRESAKKHPDKRARLSGGDSLTSGQVDHFDQPAADLLIGGANCHTERPRLLKGADGTAAALAISSRPSLQLFLTEPARSGLDSLTLLPSAPWLACAPVGHGQPVLVLPGLLATDNSTLALRSYLRYLGYAVHGWALGRNHGPTAAVADGIPSAVERLHRQYKQPVALIGWSLGGIYARHVARRAPHLISQVITLGSPFALTHPRQTRAMVAFNWRASQHVAHDEISGRPKPDCSTLPVPCTSVYSRTDGIVAWQACREDAGPYSESVAVRCSHLGFGHRASVLWLVADRLAQHPDSWQRFTPSRRVRWLYPADVSAAT